MANYNNLSVTNTVSGNDLAAVYSNQNGTTLGVSLTNLKTFFQSDDSAAAFVAGYSTNILGSTMLATSNGTLSMTTSLAVVPRALSGLTVSNILLPNNSSNAFTASPSSFAFTANRTVKLAKVDVSILTTGNASGTSFFDIAIRVGPAAGYVDFLASKGFSSPGLGVDRIFSLYVYNPSNANNIIMQNESISLLVAGNAAGSVSIRGLQFAVTTLDGV